MPWPITDFRTVSEIRKLYLKLCQRAGLVKLLVSRGCGSADPIAYGIEESGTEGRIVTGA
jgi:hypothetical protein